MTQVYTTGFNCLRGGISREYQSKGGGGGGGSEEVHVYTCSMQESVYEALMSVGVWGHVPSGLLDIMRWLF